MESGIGAEHLRLAMRFLGLNGLKPTYAKGSLAILDLALLKLDS